MHAAVLLSLVTYTALVSAHRLASGNVLSFWPLTDFAHGGSPKFRINVHNSSIPHDISNKISSAVARFQGDDQQLEKRIVDSVNAYYKASKYVGCKAEHCRINRNKGTISVYCHEEGVDVKNIRFWTRDDGNGRILEFRRGDVLYATLDKLQGKYVETQDQYLLNKLMRNQKSSKLLKFNPREFSAIAATPLYRGMECVVSYDGKHRIDIIFTMPRRSFSVFPKIYGMVGERAADVGIDLCHYNVFNRKVKLLVSAQQKISEIRDLLKGCDVDFAVASDSIDEELWFRTNSNLILYKISGSFSVPLDRFLKHRKSVRLDFCHKDDMARVHLHGTLGSNASSVGAAVSKYFDSSLVSASGKLVFPENWSVLFGHKLKLTDLTSTTCRVKVSEKQQPSDFRAEFRREFRHAIVNFEITHLFKFLKLGVFLDVLKCLHHNYGNGTVRERLANVMQTDMCPNKIAMGIKMQIFGMSVSLALHPLKSLKKLKKKQWKPFLEFVSANTYTRHLKR